MTRRRALRGGRLGHPARSGDSFTTSGGRGQIPRIDRLPVRELHLVPVRIRDDAEVADDRAGVHGCEREHAVGARRCGRLVYLCPRGDREAQVLQVLRQMTGPEIAQAPRYGLNPIVLVVNNGGWQIFRPVVARAELLDLPPWPYARLADDWGGRGFYVERVDELRAALAAAARLESFVVIEAIVRPDDLSPVSRKYIEASTRRGRVAS